MGLDICRDHFYRPRLTVHYLGAMTAPDPRAGAGPRRSLGDRSMSRRTGMMGLVLLALAGCLGPQARLQMAEDAETKKDLSIKTVGDIADIGVTQAVQVSGIA